MMEILPHLSYPSAERKGLVVFPTRINYSERNRNNNLQTEHVPRLEELGLSNSDSTLQQHSVQCLVVPKIEKDDISSSEIELSQESIESDDSLNSIKNQLKNSILKRRQKEGKADLKIEFKDPEPHQLTSEELKKRELRKAQNRLSARKSRQKRSTKISKLKSEINILEAMQGEMRELYAFLGKEKKMMENLLRVHSKCENFHCKLLSDKKNLEYCVRSSTYNSELPTQRLQAIKRKYLSQKACL